MEQFNPFTYKPAEISGYFDECNSWHDSCYIHSGLNNPFVICDLKGPGARAFLEKYIVNTLENRPVGKGMHAILCNEDGKITSDGIIIKLGDDFYRTFCLMTLPALYAADTQKYDMTFTDRTGEIALYQLCGPRSLEIVEAALKQDMHQLKFMRYIETEMDGIPVGILRAGMAGKLGYEIHFHAKDADAIYQKVMNAGKPYGLVQLGRHAYRNTHTEGGFTQGNIHFWYADYGHEFDNRVGMRAAADKPAIISLPVGGPPNLYYDGSMSDAPLSSVYRTPTECGWAKMVKFDHDFIGRAALEEEAKDPKRVMVTLVWNHEDILDVWKSLLTEGEPYKRMDVPEDLTPYEACVQLPNSEVSLPGTLYILQDRTYKNGKEIGISSGRVYSPHYREMISLCTIDKAFCEVGTEVEILWGNPATRQKRIRAVVAPFPYVQEARNEKLDVSSIPSGVPNV